MQLNKWKEVWNNREDKFDAIELSDKKNVFLELKRLDGFDIVDGGLPYEDLFRQYVSTKENLCVQGGGQCL